MPYFSDGMCDLLSQGKLRRNSAVFERDSGGSRRTVIPSDEAVPVLVLQLAIHILLRIKARSELKYRI